MIGIDCCKTISWTHLPETATQCGQWIFPQKIKMAASVVDVFGPRSFSVSPSLFKGNNYSIR